jgi:uncharacterized repeat protein (TIGR02543 family)
MNWWAPVPNVAITFDPAGGTGTMADQIVPQGSQASLTANRFTREGYVFRGWSTVRDGDVVYDDQEALTVGDNMTLYAVWGRPDPTITGMSNVPEGESVEVDDEVEFTFVMTNRDSRNATPWYDVKAYPTFNDFFAYIEDSVQARINGVLIDGITYDDANDRLVIPVGQMNPGDTVVITLKTKVLEPAEDQDVALYCGATGELTSTVRSSALQTNRPFDVTGKCVVRVRKS